MEKQLPKNWIEVQLIDILEVLENGSRPKGGVQNIFDGVPSLGGEHLDSNGGFKFGKLKYVPTSFAEKMNRGKIKENDILIVKDGATTGKTSFVDNNFPFDLAFVNEHVFICRTFQNLNSKCVFYFLFGKSGFSRIMENFTGSAQGGINQKFASNTLIPLPPLTEQNRIVTKLDTLFNQLETIKESIAKIPVLLKEFRQQVLTQAVTGKLTEEWRKGKELESADILIQKIIQKRIQDFDLKCKLAKEKGERKPTKVLLDKLPKIEIIDVDLPEKWFQTNVHFLSFVTKLAGFEYSLHFDLKEEGEIPVVRAQNVQMGKFEDKNRLYMSKETSDILVRSQLHGREILMVFIGAGTGNVCLAPKDERWHLAPNVAKIDVDGISTEYLYLYLQSALGIKNVLSRVKATAQPSLSMETIRDIVALVPPLEEQYEIVSRVENLFAKADAIEQQYQSLKEKIDNLPQALLHKAFKGELTEQLESDGDARELLKQIQELKNSNVKPKKATSTKVKKYPKNETVLGMVAEPE